MLTIPESWQPWAVGALLATSVTACALAYQYRTLANTYKRAVGDERAGRTNAERKLRQQQQQKQSAEGFSMAPIGIVESCFPHRCGTPRQGLLVPHAKGKIVMTTRIPPESLENLMSYSHIWVVFVFHENTNVTSGKGLERGRTFPAKVRPPQLLGARVGLFSTRTPHRPNPIGLSVVTLDRVDVANRVVYISGLDLVNGTPVLDIKPYIPVYDSHPSATYPDWIESTAQAARQVAFSSQALARLDELQTHLRFYQTPVSYTTMLTELLPLDIRSVRQGRGTSTGARAVYRAQVDGLVVEFVTLDNDFEVVDFTVPSAADAPEPDDAPATDPLESDVVHTTPITDAHHPTDGTESTVS